MTSHLLIVEDDIIFSQLLKRSLHETSFFSDIYVINSVSQAILLIPTIQIDYAIVDLKLHEDSGLKMISEIKRYHEFAKILMLTGYASIATTVEAIKLGATQYLPKPASILDILKALEITNYSSKEISISEQPLSVARLEWEHIQRVLTEHQGNISATARALNMHRRTLQRKLNEKNPPKS